MLIDWFTVLAQALNFFILVWLMKRFLYKPVLHAIDEREKRISVELANADKQKADAKKEGDDFRDKNKAFDLQRTELLSKTTRETQVERDRLLDEVRKAALAKSTKQQETWANEEHQLHQDIIRRTQQEVFAISRRALKDLAGVTLEERMVDIFLRRLRAISGEEKEVLASALKTSPSPVVVRTVVALSPPQQSSIESTIHEIIGKDTKVQFNTLDDLVGGIELTVNGQKVAWTIADYLASLEKGIGDLLKAKDKPEAKSP